MLSSHATYQLPYNRLLFILAKWSSMCCAVSICVREKNSSVKGKEMKTERKRRRGNQRWVIYHLNCRDRPKPSWPNIFSNGYCFCNYFGIFKEIDDADNIDIMIIEDSENPITYLTGHLLTN